MKTNKEALYVINDLKDKAIKYHEDALAQELKKLTKKYKSKSED